MQSKSKKISDTVCYLIIIAVSFVLNLTLQSSGDDFIFQKGIERYGNIAGWLSFYANNWSGRLIPHGILVCLLNLPGAVFTVLNSTALALLPHMLARCLFDGDAGRNAKFKLALFVLLIIAIPDSVWAYAVFWKCASVLYLWGTIAALAAMRPFILQYRSGDAVKPQVYVAAVFGAVYVSGFEQMAAFLAVFMIITVLWNGLKLKRKTGVCLAITAVTLSLTLFFAGMPGNRVRLFAETVQRMPNYDMYSVWDKIFMGIEYLLTCIQKHCVYLFCALGFIVTAYLYKTAERGRKPILLAGGGVSVYYSLALICRWTQGKTRNTIPVLNKLFTFAEFDSVFFEYNIKRLLPTLVGFAAFCTLGLLLIAVSSSSDGDIIKPLLYFGGGCTVIIMGFSPSIFASGDRTLFIFAVFLISATLMAGNELLSLAKEQKLNKLE